MSAPSTRPVPRRRLVIGHRGACGYRPEHTAASYALAARMGADSLDVDLVSSADGVLVVRHDDDISATTDVAGHPELADRKTTRLVGGAPVTAWFAQDLTLAELKSLRAIERLPTLRPANTAYDGQEEVLTFAEVLVLREELSAELGREVAIAPETKRSTSSAALGLPLEPPLLAALAGAGLLAPGAPVVVQSFETTNLRALHDAAPQLRLAQLVDAAGAPDDLVAAGDPRTWADLLTPAGLAGIATYAGVLAPHKALVLAAGGARLVADATAAGLEVWAWTSRSENAFLAPALRLGDDPAAHGLVLQEQRQLWDAGVSGVFADQPDTALESRARAG